MSNPRSKKNRREIFYAVVFIIGIVAAYASVDIVIDSSIEVIHNLIHRAEVE